VILGAGRGIRLGPLGRTIPKGFLQLAPGHEPIIAESIARLRSRGIGRVVLVTGHLRGFYDALRVRTAGLITVHNPRFAASGSMYSLACARELVTDDFLLLESDLVYECRALDAALESPYADVVVVSGRTGSGDEVYVAADGERITAISKDRALADRSVGELVGISKISGALYERMLQRSEGDLAAEYESGTLARVAREYPVGYALVPDLVWAEIDTPAHLRRVRAEVYPRLQRLEARNAAENSEPHSRFAGGRVPSHICGTEDG
jgi:2-aminoethylphosphonate-pyruvate transaminase